MSDQSNWEPVQLSADDEALIEAYRQVGRSLDELPYTNDFENLFAHVGRPDTQENRHAVFKRLLTLRKMGQLPRLSPRRHAS